MMEDENERNRRNDDLNPNANRNRRPRVHFVEDNAPPNRPQPFDPLSILVPVTDVVLILLAIIVAISCVSSVGTGIIAYLRSKNIISESTLGGIFCKYVHYHEEMCSMWN